MLYDGSVPRRTSIGQLRRQLKGKPGAVTFTTAMFLVLLAIDAAAQSPRIENAPSPGTYFNSTGVKPSPAEEWMLRSPEGGEAPLVSGKEKAIEFGAGARKSARGWTYICSSDRLCRLGDPMAPNRPLIARYVAWTISNISWQAGLNWPVFTVVCPDPNYDYRMKFRDAHPFQILPVFGGNYWLGCNSSASATGQRPTEVVFWVNDFPNTYGDNAGTYEVTIWGYW